MADDATPSAPPRLSEQHLAEVRASVASAEYGSEQEALDAALAAWRNARLREAFVELSSQTRLEVSRGEALTTDALRAGRCAPSAPGAP